MNISHRSILAGAISLLVVIIIAFGAVSLLQSLHPRKTSLASQTTSTHSGSVTGKGTEPADNTIAALKQKNVLPVFSTAQVSSFLSQPVYYQEANKPYIVETQTSRNVTFLTPIGSPDNVSTISTQLSDFMTKNGYAVVTLNSKSNNLTSKTTYADQNSVCQFSPQVATQTSGGSYSISCVTPSDIEQEYTAVSQLVPLYAHAGHDTNYTEIDRNRVVTQGNKSLAVTTFYTDPSHSSQELFAALNGSWEYIVNLSGSANSPTNGKYSTSPAVEAALSNPKYGSFLKDNL